jgi:glycosyltransferase involved in cell wall biosynthesis
MPKVSVILPNYNHANHLTSRIDSILNQSFTDFEIIFLDDASKDDSLTIIEAYTDSRITHIVKNTQNSGSTFLQWEKGLKLATGQYIWIAESDDVASPDFLLTLVSKLEANTELAVAFSASTWIDQNGIVIHETSHESENLWNAEELITGDFLKGTIIYNASSAVFRKEGIKNVDFTELSKFRYAGDWLFWVQLIKDKKVYRTSQRLNQFRRHDGNVSFKAEKEGLQFKEGLKIVFYIFANYSVDFLKKRKILLYWAKKIAKSDVADIKKILSVYPKELSVYTAILKLIS